MVGLLLLIVVYNSPATIIVTLHEDRTTTNVI